MSNAIDVEALRAAYLNEVFDEVGSHAGCRGDGCLRDEFAGEVSPCFTDPSDPDFQAPPTLPASIHPSRRRPKGFPKVVGARAWMPARAVHCHRPIRPGVKLTANTHMHDIYTKTGRSGRMVFFRQPHGDTRPRGPTAGLGGHQQRGCGSVRKNDCQSPSPTLSSATRCQCSTRTPASPTWPASSRLPTGTGHVSPTTKRPAPKGCPALSCRAS